MGKKTAETKSWPNTDSPYCKFLQINKTNRTMQILKDAQMGKGYSWAVLLYIISKTDARNISCVSRKEIAFRLDITERAVTNATNNLQKCGVLSVQKSAENGNNARTFSINSDVMWQSERNSMPNPSNALGTFTRMNFEKSLINYWITFAKDEPTAFTVLMYLSLKADYETNCCHESNAEITQNLGFGSYHTTLKAIECLKENGCISFPLGSKERISGYAVSPRLFWGTSRKKIVNAPYCGQTTVFSQKNQNESDNKKARKSCELSVNEWLLNLTNSNLADII